MAQRFSSGRLHRDVRSWQKRTYRVALHMSAFGGKADMM
jgi:hypothetical protein